MRAAAVRLLAGFCALAAASAVLPVTVGSLFVVLLSAERPDPDAPAGDPCCAPPESWGEAIGGTVSGIAGFGVALGLPAVVAAGLAFALQGRLPAWTRRRVVRGLAVVWAGLVGAALLVPLVVA